jgi:hypothetical protein
MLSLVCKHFSYMTRRRDHQICPCLLYADRNSAQALRTSNKPRHASSHVSNYQNSLWLQAKGHVVTALQELHTLTPHQQHYKRSHPLPQRSHSPNHTHRQRSRQRGLPYASSDLTASQAACIVDAMNYTQSLEPPRGRNSVRISAIVNSTHREPRSCNSAGITPTGQSQQLERIGNAGNGQGSQVVAAKQRACRLLADVHLARRRPVVTKALAAFQVCDVDACCTALAVVSYNV